MSRFTAAAGVAVAAVALTTAACATPGTRWVKPSTSQPTSVPVPTLTSLLLAGRSVPRRPVLA